MKIATVTLNPAIDQTVRVDHFLSNTVNYAQTMQFDAGGKGVNVASFLADAGFTVSVTGFLGRDNSEVFERYFAVKGIDDRFVRIPGNTRIGVKIVDEANQQTTDINMPGLSPFEGAMEKLFERVEQLTASCDWFALSGTLPPGVPQNTYAALITLLKKHGKRVVLDTSRDALREGLQAVPTIVKPNIDELHQLTGLSLLDEVALEQAARTLLERGIELVVISMGERGAMFVNATSSLVAVPPPVMVKSTVGAGDAMVAGIIAGQARELSLPDCARLATAFSLGAITQVGHKLPDQAAIQAYFQRVSLRY
ncbi:MAG TPA: 1-phosphofructokinase [Ktedonobacteraceae bacterium]|nr:1-phosphofructokinase [Ktedonobacteraceae bacterium]